WGRFFHAITFGLFFLQVADVSIILSASFGGFLDYHKHLYQADERMGLPVVVHHSGSLLL
ncbi:MAG: hypothetical protein FWG40_12910, partial [Peptococcaceae bacterium]|nr:hypothetical protein [Peptococcaceae bacterium]